MTQPDFELNYFGLTICGIVSFLISAIWFGPLFGKVWLEYSHLNQKKMEDIQSEKRGKKLTIAAAGTLLTSVIYSWFIWRCSITSIWELVLFDALICTGFLFTNMLNGVLWGRQKIQTVLINLSYQFVNLLGQGIIILILNRPQNDVVGVSI